MYGRSGIYGHFGLCSFMFSFATLSKLIIFVFFYYIVTFNLFFFHILKGYGKYNRNIFCKSNFKLFFLLLATVKKTLVTIIYKFLMFFYFS